MSWDVNIQRILVCLFGLLLLITARPTTLDKSNDYCSKRCQCEHAQVICGGARRGYSMMQITEIPAKLDEITSRLEIGNFSRNLITNIKFGDFFGLEVTRILDLSHNRIQTIEEGSFEMKTLKIKLRILFLSYNRLDKLQSGMFRGLGSLWQLYVGHNKLHVIAHNAFMNLNELHMLSLRDALSQWDFSTRPLTSLDHLKMIYLAQTNATSCSCGFRNFIDDVISNHIDVIDEREATQHCSTSNVTCENMPILYNDAISDVTNSKLFGLVDLLPPVSPSGIITYEGRSYSLYVPEGKRLLMVFDTDMRRKIARIQEPMLRDDYERRFRLNMRQTIDKVYYGNEIPIHESTRAESATNEPIIETTAIQLRLLTSQIAMADLQPLGLHISTQVNYLQDKHQTPTIREPFLDEKKLLMPLDEESASLDVNVLIAISLGSLIIVLMAAIFIALTMRITFRSKLGEDKPGRYTSCSGCTRLFENITSKLAIRKIFIEKRGSTSAPKKEFSYQRKSDTEISKEKNTLKRLRSAPLPEDAIQALTREQRRRSLGGQSRASSEITAFDSDSDSEQELFHERYFTSR